MQSVDLLDLEKLDNDLKAILDKVPERRKELHERISEMLKEEVDAEIANSGLNDSKGRVRDWQEPHVGSRGGYAVIRAASSSVGNNSPGAITNYLENGHTIRNPSGGSKRYKPRIKTPYVEGFHFYSSARRNVEAKALEAAEEYVKEIAERLEG